MIGNDAGELLAFVQMIADMRRLAPTDWDAKHADVKALASRHGAGWGRPGAEDYISALIDRALDILARQALSTTATPASDGKIRDAAQFLSDRLDDLEWMDGDLEATLRDFMGHVDPAHARLRTILAAATPAPDRFGYADAFYEIAAMLGIGARPDSPAKVWADEMKPLLAARLAPDRSGGNEPTPEMIEAGRAAAIRSANTKASSSPARFATDIYSAMVAVAPDRFGEGYRAGVGAAGKVPMHVADIIGAVPGSTIYGALREASASIRDLQPATEQSA
jgi:hypothetical protein